jgi:hypothetical protein
MLSRIATELAMAGAGVILGAVGTLLVLWVWVVRTWPR